MGQGQAKALYAFSDVDYADWEHDENSVTNEVLGALDMLDMNLALPEDAPIYLEFLATPLGQFQAGYTSFQRRIQAIDYEGRRRLLQNVPPYDVFLKP